MLSLLLLSLLAARSLAVDPNDAAADAADAREKSGEVDKKLDLIFADVACLTCRQVIGIELGSGHPKLPELPELKVAFYGKVDFQSHVKKWATIVEDKNLCKALMSVEAVCSSKKCNITEAPDFKQGFAKVTEFCNVGGQRDVLLENIDVLENFQGKWLGKGKIEDQDCLNIKTQVESEKSMLEELGNEDVTKAVLGWRHMSLEGTFVKKADEYENLSEWEKPFCDEMFKASEEYLRAEVCSHLGPRCTPPQKGGPNPPAPATNGTGNGNGTLLSLLSVN